MSGLPFGLSVTPGMRRLCASVLGMEAIVLGLITPVAITIGKVPAGLAAAVGLGLAVCCVVVAGLLKRPFAYIAAAKLGLAGLGLYLTWSTSVAYEHYETVPRIWGLTAVEDQNVGGAMMMLEQSVVLLIAFVVLFVQMLTQSEADEQRRERLERAAPA